MITRLIAILMSFAFTSAAWADLPDPELVEYVESRIETGEYVGMIVGYIDGNDTFIQAFGKKAIGGSTPPDKHSIFEISSISKTFAATLLAGLVIDGRVELDDPVNQHITSGATFKNSGPTSITLLDLAAHQSGLPYMPSDMESIDGPNPYARTTDNDLVRAINAFTPTSSPGEGYSYSAFAYGTIAHILATKTDSSFEALVAEKLTMPLDMRDTVFELSDEQSTRLATGYTPEGEIAEPFEQGVFRAAGSMYSSIHDLLNWLRLNMHPDNTPVGLAAKMTHEIRNSQGTIGLSWHRTEGYDDRSQYGTAHGYRAYVGFLADGSKGAVVLANTKANVADIGSRLLLGLELPDDAPGQ